MNEKYLCAFNLIESDQFLNILQNTMQGLYELLQVFIHLLFHIEGY